MPTEREMVEGWLRGEEAALRALFGLYFPRAIRIGALSGLTPDEANDCAQETFIHAFERRAQLRDPQAFSLWFHRILTRRILDALDARTRRREDPLAEGSELAEDWQRQQLPPPEMLAIEAELRAELWEQVQALPAQYRLPLVLRYYGDFSTHEVAELLGAREGTVRVQLHRALGRLRLHMATPPADPSTRDRLASSHAATSRDGE